jgi:hypothetical protein
MVSSMSAISACSSGVVELFDRAGLRAQARVAHAEDGLIIARQHRFDDRRTCCIACSRTVMDGLQADALATVAAPGGVVGDDVDRRIGNASSRARTASGMPVMPTTSAPSRSSG